MLGSNQQFSFGLRQDPVPGNRLNELKPGMDNLDDVKITKF